MYKVIEKNKQLMRVLVKQLNVASHMIQKQETKENSVYFSFFFRKKTKHFSLFEFLLLKQ